MRSFGGESRAESRHNFEGTTTLVTTAFIAGEASWPELMILTETDCGRSYQGIGGEQRRGECTKR